MTEFYPVPPPDLVEQWREETCPFFHLGGINDLATKAAQWGADQELEACCEWLRSKDILEPAIDALRAARRPKPPSLKEQALEALDRMDQLPTAEDQHIIRRALEQLND